MRRKSKQESRESLRESVEEVLQGKVRPRVERLLGLFSLLNPTGPELPEVQARERGVDQADAAALLKHGIAARERYDYENAVRFLTLAVERSGKAPPQVTELLKLLVDYLGEDEEALELAAQLPGPVLDVPEARILLAVAAARRGLEQEALAYSRDLEGERVEEVLLMLADRAIQAEAWNEAKEHLDRAQRSGANPAAIHSRRKTLEGLLTEMYSEIEKAIQEDWEGGQRERARWRAQDLLAAYPQSEVARQILRAIQDEEERTE